jgi:hypothetical protein
MRAVPLTLAIACCVAGAWAAGCVSGPCGTSDASDDGLTDDVTYQSADTCQGDFTPAPPPGTPAHATCSTGSWWQRANAGSELMHPGVNCVTCHASLGAGLEYSIAGTVMGAQDDADNCQGISNVSVNITDSAGNAQSLTTDAAGNFFVAAAIATPFSVSVTRDGKTAPMVAHQSDGACLSCHTSTGRFGAPGRIVAP